MNEEEMLYSPGLQKTRFFKFVGF